MFKSVSLQYLSSQLGSINLPIWANFVDPLHLSLYDHLEQSSSIGWTQPHPQPQNFENFSQLFIFFLNMV